MLNFSDVSTSGVPHLILVGEEEKTSKTQRKGIPIPREECKKGTTSLRSKRKGGGASPILIRGRRNEQLASLQGSESRGKKVLSPSLILPTVSRKEKERKGEGQRLLTFTYIRGGGSSRRKTKTDFEVSGGGKGKKHPDEDDCSRLWEWGDRKGKGKKRVQDVFPALRKKGRG